MIRYSKAKDTFGFFLCDVSGHGVPAALLAAMVKMSLTYWYEHLHKLTESFHFIYESIFDKLGKACFTNSKPDHDNLSNGKLRTARTRTFSCNDYYESLKSPLKFKIEWKRLSWH
ncbi:MAG: SpoIIE family protein phosphatase [Leptospiraceae bacterium]|nr:SpoIIE family protein phosphatase [Leptospiraceae bacterium]